MRVLMINSVCGIRSTGRICTDLAKILEEQGHEVKIAYGRESVPEEYAHYAVRIGNDIGVKLHGLKARIFDRHAFGSKCATRKFIKWVKHYDPDVIHLHNLHGYYLNIKILFDYIRSCGKRIIWSLYDCWAFTGHCSHFDYIGCDKWKSGCYSCPQLREYPKSLFIDNSKMNYKQKKELFSNISNLTLVAPSQWLADVTKQSFLGSYPMKVIQNGIDLSVFKPMQSDFKAKNGLEDKKIILGVASTWNKTKGPDYMNRLAEDLPTDKYQVVMVGNIVEKFQKSDSIIHIPCTNSIAELCAIYSAADVFVNPTLQETQGLTTLEAFSCGTPAVVFRSGGAADCIDNSCGIQIERGNYDEFLNAVITVCEEKSFSANACIEKSKEYDKDFHYKMILNLYNEILENERI